MVVEQKVDVYPKVVVDIIELLYCRCIFKDFNQRISIFNYIQNTIRLLLLAIINCFVQYIPYKYLFDKAVKI